MSTLTGDSANVNSGFDNPPNNPLLLLKQWLSTAEKTNVREPNGVVLSTIDKLGRPSSRVVLLKECDDRGIIFGTSNNSLKALDLRDNPFAAGNLWWRETLQQISFQGTVTELDRQTSESLFSQRCKEAQAVAAISSQSQLMIDKKKLESQIATLIKNNREITCPKSWSAYHFMIHSIEFWLGSKSRIHQRLKYQLKDEQWTNFFLQP